MSAFNKKQYKRFKRNRRIGIGLLVPGLTLIFTAVGLAIAGALEGEEFFFAALGVEATGDCLFFPGMGLMIQGKRGMAKAKAGFYKDKSKKHTLSLRGITPITFKNNYLDKDGLGFGATLSF